VNTLSSDFNALKDQVENADVTDMRNDVTELQSQVAGENGLTDRISKAEQDVNKLQQDVDKLEADLAAADVSVLTNRVQEAENKINQLSENDTKIRNDFSAADSALKQSIENDYKAADSSLASRITMINSTNAEQSSKIAEHGGKIAALESKDVDLQAQIGQINTTLSNYGTFTTALTQEIENRTRADEQFKQQIENIYIQDEFTKAEAGILVEKENQLRQELQNEISRAEGVEQSLLDTINGETQRAQAAEEQIAQNLTNVDTALKERLDLIDGEEGSINNLQSQIQSNDKDIADIQQLNSNQQTSIEENTTAISSIQESLKTSVVKNDYEVGVDKTFVAAIKFIKPDIENNLTAEQVYEALVAAGQIDKNTLYLIQEEE
jgi:chromosome segregation ATPase